MGIEDPNLRANKLTEYNVLHGAVSVATSQCVAQAWKFGNAVSIHALVYDLRDGILREIMPAITGQADLEKLLQNSAIAPCTSQWYAKA
jgi:carbonic anhydrase